MTRVSHVTDEDASDAVERVFAAAENQFGLVPNIARTMGHSDAVAAGFIGTEGDLFATSSLGHELLEKVGVAVSAANGCDYCVDAHTLSLARNFDIPEAELEAIVAGASDELSDREGVAVAFGVAAAADAQSIPEEVHEAVQAEFTDQEIVEITGTAALFQGINLFADALAVDPDG
jgi:uncharacterized peroxidase-related enzyme